MTGFYCCHKTVKNFKSFCGFGGGRSLKTKYVCMDFEPDFKVHDLVSVHNLVPVPTEVIHKLR